MLSVEGKVLRWEMLHEPLPMLQNDCWDETKTPVYRFSSVCPQPQHTGSNWDKISPYVTDPPPPPFFGLFYSTLVDLVLICKRKQQQRCGECKDLQSFYSWGIFSLVCETSLMLPHADVRPPLLFKEGGVPPKGSYYRFIVLFHALYNLMDSRAEPFSRCFSTVNSLHWGGEQETDGARHYI